MKSHKSRFVVFTHVFIIAAVALMVAACASVGRPEGGARDVEPPVFVRSRPTPGAVNVPVDTRRIELFFDENLQLDDPFNKVIVSPTLKNQPQVIASGRRLWVELRDSLRDSTTYTIDFADAIKDLNEGNIIDGFAYDFSTGPTIDTLRISGMVLQASNLEPAQGMLVGVYSNFTDTSATTTPFDRIARTNQYGAFTIRNLKPGSYRVFALNDVNRDYHWDRSEDVAFYDVDVEPSVEAITVSDTLRAADGSDSLVSRPGVRYLPNDMLLTWFNENFEAQYLKDYTRPTRRRIDINFAAKSDTVPELKVVGGRFDGAADSIWALRQTSVGRDSLQYWIADTSLLATDSLYLSMRYQRMDSASQLVWTTDTLKFFFKPPKVKKKEKKKDEDADSVEAEPITLMRVNMVTSTQHEVYAPLLMEFDQPLLKVDSAAIHLDKLVDTVWTAVTPVPPLMPDTVMPLLRRFIKVKWEPGAKYRLTVDSAAITGIYGEWNGPLTHEFTVRPTEDYANITLRIKGIDNGAMVELLNGSDDALRAVPVVDGVARIRHVDPGTYYLRLYIDTNSNRKWDTGSVAQMLQPEEVFYYPRKLQLKKNWDIDQTWDIYETPVDRQKPYELIKNKPKLKNGERDPRQQEVEYDEFGNPIDPDDEFSTRRYDDDFGSGRNSRRNGRNQGFGGQNGMSRFGGMTR